MGSRDKGSRGELEVRDLLRAWWAPVEPGLSIERAPSSGGWHAAAAFRAAGDLVVPAGARFPWSVEVKRREDWSLPSLLRGGQSPVWTWWAQATRDALRNRAWPLLWCRRSRSPWVVLADARQAKLAGVAPEWTWIGDVVGWPGPVFLASSPRAWESTGDERFCLD